MAMVKKITIFLLIVLFISFSFVSPGFSATDKNYIRVAIIQDAASCFISISGTYDIIDTATNNSLYRARNLRNKEVSIDNNIITIGSLKFNSKNIQISPRDQISIKINNRHFRGRINIIAKPNNKFTVVNLIEVEDYIKGVLYHEISPVWPIEIIKAQAVIARTYALYQAMNSKDKEFDVTSDIYSQVYGGRTSEKYRTNIGVDSTKGEYLTYQGQIFPAYYHATCGGKTENAANLWNIDIVPLRGVECGYCSESPHIRWDSHIPLSKIKEDLANNGYKVGEINDISILERNSSGRISRLKIIYSGSSGDESLVISGKDFRQALGPNIIKSTNFNIKIIDSVAYFYGLGWGHGVGFCQWGGKSMAEKGFKYDKIIEYYYPGAKITK